mmetsp:Transcript_89118/g.236788  ORF Transcript_89118/g.236788 Transcript_89118/m.236788 type:complete len:360 (-) Transcript_89118:231-1310(-)
MAGTKGRTVEKSRNLPVRLLKAIRAGDEPYLLDLHGYGCEMAEGLMERAFCEKLPVPVCYTFTLGRGLHSERKFVVELAKACCEGLRKTGLDENRHASPGSIGKFKVIHDKDTGMTLIRVYAKALPGASQPKPCQASAPLEGSTEQLCEARSIAELVVEEAVEAGIWETGKLAASGLAQVLLATTPVLCRAKEGKRLLDEGQPCSPLQEEAWQCADSLQEAWRAAFRALCAEVNRKELCLAVAEKQACLDAFGVILAESIIGTSAKTRVEELKNRVEACGERELSRAQAALHSKLKKAEEAAVPLREKLDRWQKGKFRFESLHAKMRMEEDVLEWEAKALQLQMELRKSMMWKEIGGLK